MVVVLAFAVVISPSSFESNEQLGEAVATVTEVESVQPFASVIVTEYVAAANPVMLAVVALVLHEYV